MDAGVGGMVGRILMEYAAETAIWTASFDGWTKKSLAKKASKFQISMRP